MVQHSAIDHTGITGVGGSLTVENEGTPLATAATTLDFVGAGVTASGTGAEKTITIAGVGIVPWSIVPEGGATAVVFRSVGTANRAVYAPCTIPADCTITGVRIVVGVQNGNICIGLYDSGGSRVATSGSVACPASGVASVSFTGNYSATAGRYYLALQANGTTATFGWMESASGGAASPATSKFENVGALPLPATASFSTPISTPAIIGLVNGGHP